MGAGIVGAVATTGEPLNVPDAYRDPLERVFDWAELNAEGHDQVERTVVVHVMHPDGPDLASQGEQACRLAWSAQASQLPL